MGERHHLWLYVPKIHVIYMDIYSRVIFKVQHIETN